MPRRRKSPWTQADVKNSRESLMGAPEPERRIRHATHSTVNAARFCFGPRRPLGSGRCGGDSLSMTAPRWCKQIAHTWRGRPVTGCARAAAG